MTEPEQGEQTRDDRDSEHKTDGPRGGAEGPPAPLGILFLAAALALALVLTLVALLAYAAMSRRSSAPLRSGDRSARAALLAPYQG